MLNLYEHNADRIDSLKNLGTLYGAVGIKVRQEINAEYSLTFKYPRNGIKAKDITVNRIVGCEEQLYRILSITSSVSESMLTVNAVHVYDSDAKIYHLPTMKEGYGVSPRGVIEEAFRDTKFHVMTYEEITKIGLKWVGDDGFLIDFETMDKTSPFSVMEQVIENCGFGEIYKDNYNVALVRSVGGFEGKLAGLKYLRLSTIKNLSDLAITRDTSSIVNRLYPYGENDATISAVTEGNVPYIESSESIEKYGLKSGYKDYSDYKNPSDILLHAQHEFSKDNPDRIDTPSISIEGKVIDLSRLEGHNQGSEKFGMYEKPVLGRGVKVLDIDGTEYTERITRLEYYPYEPEETVVTIGHVQRDEVFYLSQMGKLVGLKWRIY